MAVERNDRINLKGIQRTFPTGIALAMLSGACLGITNILTKYIYHINPFVQLFIRGIINSALCLSVCIYSRQPIIVKTDSRTVILLLMYSLSMSATYICMNTSFKFISVSDSTAIKFTFPALVALTSIVVLRDKCKVTHVFTVSLSVIGSFLICKPQIIFGGTSTDSDVYGILLAFGVCIFKTVIALTLRLLRKYSWSTLSLYQGLFLAMSCAIILSAGNGFDIHYCNYDGIIIIVCGFLTTVATVVVVLASKMESPRNLSVSQTVEIPIVMLLQVIILGRKPEWNSYVGTVFIISSVGLIWMVEWWKTRPNKSKTGLTQVLRD